MPNRLLICLCASVLILSGCASMGDKPAYTEQAKQLTEKLDKDIVPLPLGTATSITELIQSPELQALVDEALYHNPGLQQTLLAVEQTRQQWRQTRADQIPSIDGGFTAQKSEDSTEQYTGSVTLNWQLDLWGQLSDNSSAAEQTLLQQQALYQAARDTLAADVMRKWLSLIAQQRALAIQERKLETLTLNKSVILQRYQRGLGSLEDLDSARSSALSTQASVSELRQSIQQQQRALNRVLGRETDNQYSIPEVFPDVATPQGDSAEQTLARRPDLQAAWHAIKSADAKSSVAYKDLLPRIDLQAALEDIADSPSEALLTDPVWSLLGQLTAPLFHGGSLKAAAKQAELETAIQYQSYRETLLIAVEEVRNALTDEHALRDQQNLISQALVQQQLTLENYRKKYQSGNATILELLSVQQQTYELETRLNTLNLNRLDNRITLALALGLGVEQ